MALILASGSPRRAEILQNAGFDFHIRPADVDEALPAGTAPADAAYELALRKARAAAKLYPEDVILASDTLVAPGNTILGKPRDAADAARMLRLLSGRTHTVYTGVCVCAAGRERCEVVPTQVEFIRLTDDQIARYIATGEPMDKAGAYGIQGGAGAFVEGLEGSFENVMGFPVDDVERMLRAFAQAQ